jgi:hypothetical protein
VGAKEEKRNKKKGKGNKRGRGACGREVTHEDKKKTMPMQYLRRSMMNTHSPCRGVTIRDRSQEENKQ